MGRLKLASFFVVTITTIAFIIMMMHQAREDSLRLRPISLFDTPMIVALANDWDVASMVSRLPYPYERQHAENWIQDIEANRREEVWAIESDGQFAGCVGYTRASISYGELGYWLGKPYWGRGLATRAAWQIISHAFTAEPFRHISACHFYDNDASKKVIERLGFQHNGNSECYSIARGTNVRTEHYILTRQIYERIVQS